jgi:hypothetical protein
LRRIKKSPPRGLLDFLAASSASEKAEASSEAEDVSSVSVVWFWASRNYSSPVMLLFPN